MAERQVQWLGTVLLEPRVAHWVFATAAAAAIAAVFALLIFGSYTRKARINGWLVSEKGVVRVFVPQPGVVAEVRVREGTRVVKGTPLLTVSAEVRTEALGSSREEIVRRILDRRDSMAAQRAVQGRLFDQQAGDLKRRLEALQVEQQHILQEIEFQRSRVALAKKGLARERLLRARDLIPEPRLQVAEQEQLDQSGRLEALERTRASLNREQAQVQGTLDELPYRRQTQLDEIGRNVAALEQELAEAETRRKLVVVAPEDGIVTGLQAEPGGSANPNVPLMSLVPSGSELQAQLFSPSRAIGFVRPGQRVLLRYQSFPYQKFGSHEGIVANVSQSPVSPSELTQALSGLTSLYPANEPVYRITVQLARQDVLAYGEPIPLQPGMQLEADVMIESRRLIEWVLDPLFTITGK